MNIYTLDTPQQWQIGVNGSGPDAELIYHPCAGCGAKAPIIHGFIGNGPAWHELGVIPVGSFFKAAVYCEPCFAKVLQQKGTA